MRKATMLLAGLILAAQASHAAEPVSKSWLLCAQSNLIVVGKLHVPAEGLKPASRDSADYLTATVDVAETLKGEATHTVTVSFYGADERFKPTAATRAALNGGPALLFLITIPNPADGKPTNYFAGDDADALRAADGVAEIRAEVVRQARVLAVWRPHPQWPHEDAVRLLIARTLDDKNEQQAFGDLELLGKDAVPAMADLMDDRRTLARPGIRLQNPPGAFEGYRYYGPKLVVDALAAILNQVAGPSFGDIENGGTERQRKLAIDGWRIYVDMRLNHPDAFH